MKEIKAIVQPFMVEEILHRLENLEIPGLTLSEVGDGGDPGRRARRRPCRRPAMPSPARPRSRSWCRTLR